MQDRFPGSARPLLTRSDQILVGSHSGLRGRPGEGLTDEVVVRTVQGLVERVEEDGLPATVAVARDGRPSSRALAELVAETVLARGADVVDLGVASTPTAKLAAQRRSLGGAVIVTGSHLDPSWNGLKLVAAPDYFPLDVRELPSPQLSGHRPRGRLAVDTTAASDHAGAIVASVDAEAIRRARLRVSIAGGTPAVTELVLAELGCQLRSGEADLGLALDADGDRLELIDEHGRPVDSELVLPLVALARDAKAVVKGADTSRIVDLLVSSRGGFVRSVPTGELHLLQALRNGGGDLAGEGNGGVVVPAVGLARDGVAAAASILELMARQGATVSQLSAGLPRLARTRSTVECADPVRALAALTELAGALGLELVNAHRGIVVDRGASTWALVRASGTEPVLRITAEALEQARADALHSELRRALLAELDAA